MRFRWPWRRNAVHLVSDVHTEFMRDGGVAFAARLAASRADVLIAAGDIGVARDGSLDAIISRLVDVVPHVVFVAGNHEFYKSSPTEVADVIARLAARHPTFHPLDRSTVTIRGQRFVGATLWFPPPADRTLCSSLNDFRMIRHFEPWVYEQHYAAVAYLDRTVGEGDVVVTHHLPTPHAIADRWRGDPLNAFFAVDDLSDAVLTRPRAWVFGHTHDSTHFYLGDTEFACNPYGYEDVELNPEFDFGFRLKLKGA
ncbi:MAG: metallophosphoesterase [Myxococcales bacterium]|nr:metallophosphoesterase [Myxococcales bacterium]